MKTYFIPADDGGKDLWLSNFANKLYLYADKYALRREDVADMQLSSRIFHYWLDYKNKYEEYLRKLTAYKNQVRSGVPAGASIAVIPQPPVVDNPPGESDPDVFGRAASLAGRIKSHTHFTEADGLDMGIIGKENVLNRGVVKPSIKIRLQAGHPEVVWRKQGMSGIEIWVSREGADYVFLAISNYPNYIDTEMLPPTGKSAIWKYKVIYREHDKQTGQWSDEVSITVAGTV